MTPSKKLIYTLAVGFTILFFWSVISWWGDWIYNMVASQNRYLSVRLDEPDLLRVKTAAPKSYKPGYFYCQFMHNDFLLSQTGAGRTIRPMPEPETEFSYPTDVRCRLSFAYDKTIGQFVIRDINHKKKEPIQKIVGYLGTKGYSANFNPQTGTFSNPFYVHWIRQSPGLKGCILYDNALRRFYRIEFNYTVRKPDSKTIFYTISLDSIRVIEGPQLQTDKAVVDVWKWKENQSIFSLLWMPPQQTIRKLRPEYSEGQYASTDPNTWPDEAYREKSIPLENAPKRSTSKNEFLVLYEDGSIDYIDGNTLTVSKRAGQLPYMGFYQQSMSNRPQDIGDYDILGIYDPNDKHLGTAAAAVSRDGLSAHIVFYNDQGIPITDTSYLGYLYGKSKDGYDSYRDISGLSVLTSSPRGPLLITLRYLWENLQPPVLRLLDLPASQWFSPATGYSHLFIRPNSLIGLMKFEPSAARFWFLILFLMLPSLILSLWLAITTRIKAAKIGCSSLSKDGWVIAVLAFGIPAYITFRLTMPKERMITCANCGNLRRVDFDRCQQGKALWPDAASPKTAWQVIDAPAIKPDTP